MNPSEASALYLDMSADCRQSVDYERLLQVVDRIVTECLDRDICTKEQLGRSFIGFDHSNKRYYNRKMNVALI